ncbi:hypothetical protein Agub_g5399 [Astrephomene gubernaculifera]|uniref:Calnexin n=1 Tax=Astrephomene gubernaculifera TaxID=47775 RepID=A0AAD3HKL7_9CHLO|nr:hypothetical protein Agub_g5399 [Astrephomene gubernaculifera]
MINRHGTALLGIGLLVIFGPCAGSSEPSPATSEILESIRSQALFFEDFNDDGWQSRWKHSSDPKYNGRFITAAAKNWTGKGLKIPDSSRYYGLTALLPSPIDPVVRQGGSSGPSETPLPLVVQYEVRYDSGVTCGGSYLKLLSADSALEPQGLRESTPYSIMFGPDKCGGPGKIHLILRHRHALTGTVTEKHLSAAPLPESSDIYTHVYTLRIGPDHRYEILVDGSSRSSGSLLEEGVLAPPLLPPREVPDPDDIKPADWVEQATIPDPDAVKPEGWDEREQIEDEDAVKPKGWREDEPEMIDDPAAKKPADWDDEEDGAWEPPQLPNPRCKVGCGPWRRPLKPNPAFKGAWKPPHIPNPKYKGPWVQKRIPNPDFYTDPEPLRSGVAPIGGVALELWTVDSGYMFDNILLTRDPAVAEAARRGLWQPRHEAEVAAFEAQVKANEDAERRRQKTEAEERRKKRAQAGAQGRVAEAFEQLTERVLGLFEAGGLLSPLAPSLAPLLEWLRGNPQGSGVLLGGLPLLVLLPLLLRTAFGGGKKKGNASPVVAATEADRADGSEDEDEEPAGGEGAQQGEQESPEAAAAGGGDGDSGDAAAAAEEERKEGTKEEIAADAEEEEEEEPAAKGPRRRTPRVA